MKKTIDIAIIIIALIGSAIIGYCICQILTSPKTAEPIMTIDNNINKAEEGDNTQAKDIEEFMRQVEENNPPSDLPEEERTRQIEQFMEQVEANSAAAQADEEQMTEEEKARQIEAFMQEVEQNAQKTQ